GGDARELALEIETADFHLRTIGVGGDNHGLAVAHHHAGEWMRKLKGVPRVERPVALRCAGERNNDGAGLTSHFDRARLHHAARPFRSVHGETDIEPRAHFLGELTERAHSAARARPAHVSVAEPADGLPQHLAVRVLAGQYMNALVLVREKERQQTAVPETEYELRAH